MTSIIMVAHGHLAYAFKESAEMIFGQLQQVFPLSFVVEEGFDTVVDRIKDSLAQTEDSVLILTDLFAGTPFNAACAVALQEDKQIEVLSGLSMPMVLEAAAMQEGHNATQMKDHLLAVAGNIVKAFEPNAQREEDDF